MHKRTPVKLLTASLLVTVFLLSACAGSQPQGPTPEEILADSSQAMQAINSVEFAIERIGEPPIIDPGTGAKLISATGFYQAPDTVHAVVRAETLLGVQDLGVTWSPDGNSMNIPGLGTLDLPEGMAFNAVSVFADEGLPTILTSAISEPVLEEDQSFEGTPVHHITGTASGESLSTLTAGTVIVEDLAIDVYIEQETLRVIRITLTESSGDSWVLDLFSYDEEVVG